MHAQDDFRAKKWRCVSNPGRAFETLSLAKTINEWCQGLGSCNVRGLWNSAVMNLHLVYSFGRVNLKWTTPWKINIGPTNHPFRKESIFQTSMIMFHMNLPGCITIFYKGESETIWHFNEDSWCFPPGGSGDLSSPEVALCRFGGWDHDSPGPRRARFGLLQCRHDTRFLCASDLGCKKKNIFINTMGK